MLRRDTIERLSCAYPRREERLRNPRPRRPGWMVRYLYGVDIKNRPLCDILLSPLGFENQGASETIKWEYTNIMNGRENVRGRTAPPPSYSRPRK